MVYVAITGFRTKSTWHMPRFWWHAAASMRQASVADGNLSAEARAIDGVQHTLSVWRDRQAMLAYRNSGAHRNAMRAHTSLGSGYAFGFESDRIPDWRAVHDLWRAEGERRARPATNRPAA